ncbi:MAG: DUF6249 domain-containing protein [Steroidobacteraceae bacterium]|jgi:hypothetical protein
MNTGEILQELKPILTIMLVFLTPALVMIAVLIYRFRRQRLILEAVQRLADKGVTIAPELLQGLSSEGLLGRPAASPMRRAVLLIAAGAGLVIVLAAEGDGPAWAFGTIPLLLGLGYLVIWKLEQRGAH